MALRKFEIPTRTIIIIAFVINIGLISTIILSAIGFEIPMLRQVLGVIYLTFIPGLLIIFIIGNDKLSNVETLLYSVGISIAFIMFFGFSINIILPFLGISKPISLYPILTIMTVSTLLLSIVLSKKNLKSQSKFSILIIEPLKNLPILLVLLLIPVLSALGVFWLMLTKDDILLYIFLILVALVPILIVFDKIPEWLYPLAIFCIGLGLMWHWSLVSPTLGAYDINHEYCLQKFVVDESSWDPTHPWMVNAMLSIVILAPIYSIILNLDAVWLFKIIYPFLFSFAPVALYFAYRKQMSNKIAFLAVFFFMSWISFFTDGGGHPRQAIGEIFLALTLLVLVSRNLTKTKAMILLIIFGLSMVVSHYSISYIYMICLVIGLVLLIFPQIRKLLSGYQLHTLMTTGYILLFIIFCTSWYMYVSSGALLNNVVEIGNHIINSLTTELLSPQTRDIQVMRALGLAEMRGRELSWEVARVFQWIINIFIVIGFLKIIFARKKTVLSFEHKLLSIPTIGILVFCVVLPFFASYFNMGRFYHVTLFILAPFCIFGGIYVLKFLHRNKDACIKLLVCLILIPYFMFNTGLIFDVTQSTATSMPLSLYENDWPAFTLGEVATSKWISITSIGDSVIYGDDYAAGMIYKEAFTKARRLPSNIQDIHESSYYIFLRQWNIVHSEIISTEIKGTQVYQRHININEIPQFVDNLQNMNLVYDNGLGEIFMSQ